MLKINWFLQLLTALLAAMLVVLAVMSTPAAAGDAEVGVDVKRDAIPFSPLRSCSAQAVNNSQDVICGGPTTNACFLTHEQWQLTVERMGWPNSVFVNCSPSPTTRPGTWTLQAFLQDPKTICGAHCI